MKFAIIIVNYNGWKDTIECVESVLRSDYQHFHIFIVDNGSENDSFDKLKQWSSGELGINSMFKLPDRYKFTPVTKPINVNWIEQEQSDSAYINMDNNITVLRSNINRGFAGGNNFALEKLLNMDYFDYFWFLNNDTVVKSDTLSNYADYLANKRKKSNFAGMTGCKLFFYDNPEKLQGVGGYFNKWTGKLKIIGNNVKDRGQFDTSQDLISYPIGASFMVPIKFIKTIGMMEENYFLYFEEIDWAERGKRKGYFLDICPEAHVFHKHGVTTGQNETSFNSRLFALQLTNLLVFYKKFYPFLIISGYYRITMRLLSLLIKGHFRRFFSVVNELFSKKYPKKRG